MIVSSGPAAAVEHQAQAPWVEITSATSARLRVTTTEDVAAVSVEVSDRYASTDDASTAVAMEPIAADGRRLWSAAVHCATRRLRYRFHVRCNDGSAATVGPAHAEPGAWFQVPYLYPSDHIDRWRDWGARTVYAVMPDRFSPGPGRTQDESGRAGGTLQGVADRLSYLEELGIGVLYLNPIFQSGSYHGYDIENYFTVDPALGTVNDLLDLVRRCHELDIRVVLDGVFNHTSARHPWFHLAQTGGGERYRDRYYLRPDGSYETWANRVWSMPKLNWERGDVEPFVAQVLAYWGELGIDGWRMDVANEVPRSSWMRLRCRRPHDYWIGEIWHEAPDWVAGEPFSGTMDYALYEIVRTGLLGHSASAAEVARRLLAHSALYPAQTGALNWTLIGSHDAARATTLAGGERSRVDAALTFLHAWQGTPYLYYGDECYLEGDSMDESRGIIDWEATTGANPLVSRLTRERRLHPWLAWARLERLEVIGDLVVCRRVADDGPGNGGQALVTVNVGGRPALLDVEPWDLAGRSVDLATGEVVTTPALEVPTGGVRVLLADR